jgi:UPF0755 protein
MSKKVILIVVAVIAIVGGIIIFPKFSLFMASRKTTVNNKAVEYYIKGFTSLEVLAQDLEKQGAIDDVKAFIGVAEYKGLGKENIALGKYIIEPGTPYKTVLNGIKLNEAGNGNAEVEVDVTFNNCRDIRELGGKLSKILLIDSAAFVEILDNQKTLELFEMSREEIPSMFLPNTYKMYYDTDEKQFIERMSGEFKKFWTEDRMSKLKKVGLKKPSEAVTLASVVYSEQGRVPEEWPIIAGLYLNRINQGIKLQSDPTFKFCWGDKLEGVQRLLNVHRDIDCPYNTYKINGLPPGPICIPPTEVVDAVLNRDKNNYIFMMAKPDYTGRHDFRVEYADHEKLAKIYQNWLAQEMKNR